MARKKKRQQQNSNNQQANNTSALESKEKEINTLQSNSEISDEELKLIKIDEIEIPKEVNIKSVDNVYRQVLKLKKELDTRKVDYGKKIKLIEDEKSSLVSEKEEFQTKKKELEVRLNVYDNKLKEVNTLQVEKGFSSVIDREILDEYFSKLKEQEELLSERLSEVSKKHGEYIDLILDLDKQKQESHKAMLKELSDTKEKLYNKFNGKFKQKEQELETKESELLKNQKKLNFDIEDFEDEKEYLENKARKSVQTELDDLSHSCNILNEKNNAYQQKVEELTETLKYFGNRDPKKVIDDLKNKEDEIYKLQAQLELNPSILKVDELKRLRKEKVDWESDLQELDAKANEYKRRYEGQKLQVGEKETLEFQKDELAQRVKLQKVALEQLKDEVNHLVEQSKNSDTFVSCAQMDSDYSNKDNNLFDDTDISENWIKNLQQVIAQITSNNLYYDLNTIRSFVSGLAMSRLSILQGISGTGKTSLPKAFAEAVGGYCEVVEVQSGWKDRQDLIGYYNTFEKKYYEGKFLKALYKASTPQYKDKPFLIILDEMNLSHPEHYFADILSLMEETNMKKQILSICDKVSGKPEQMIEHDGEFRLKIPENVWFIGTANHDETTLQFAPKTYDRANIMEMPKNFDSFTIDENIDVDSVKVCNSTFLRFLENSKNNTDNFLEYINKSNFKTICNNLGIGWGNRLEKQMQNFIPTFSLLGGTDSDALDHIISTKILRTIKGRYDLQENTLKEMKNELEGNFVENFKDFPEKSLEIIDFELDKLQ